MVHKIKYEVGVESWEVEEIRSLCFLGYKD